MNTKQQAVNDYLKQYDSQINFSVGFNEIILHRKDNEKYIIEKFTGEFWMAKTEQIISRIKKLLLNLNIK